MENILKSSIKKEVFILYIEIFKLFVILKRMKFKAIISS